jgi:hypothetical protein
VFVTLLVSYAFFWQARDWNSASRLMLTYAMVDRGTVVIDGLEDQTHDRAFFEGHFYSDKLPGFSFLAAAPYAASRAALKIPPHPLNRKGFAHWPADYWVTLGTSGLLTALTGVVLAGLARDLGCGPRRSALLALSYGLATPAYAYATMSYGHQATAFALLLAFSLLWHHDRPGHGWWSGAAGFLAAYAAVIELQVGPASAVVAAYLLAQVLGGRRRWSDLGNFAVGAALPTLLLLGYNQLAFGSPFDMGYFHHDTAQFARVHSAANPLGLGRPDVSRLPSLLWGRHRGLLFYAPVTALTLPGLAALVWRKAPGAAAVAAGVIGAVLTVNLSYPEWTGGWSTGPRLLVPLLPFAVLAVAGLLACGGRWTTAAAAGLSLAGAALMLLFVGVGGRVPQDVKDPLLEVVWPIWSGQAPPMWWTGEPFARNAASLFGSDWLGRLPVRARAAQFLPLVAGQAGLVALMMLALGGSNLGVDEEQDGGRQEQEAEHPGAEPQGVAPDTGPGLVAGGRVDEADGDHQRQDEPVDMDGGHR